MTGPLELIIWVDLNIKVQVTQIFAPHFNCYFERLGQTHMQAKFFLFVKQSCGFNTELKIGNVRSKGQKLPSMKKSNELTNQQIRGEIKSMNKTVFDQVNVYLHHFA